MSFEKLLVFFSLLVLANSYGLNAQTCCTGGVPVAGALNTDFSERGVWKIGLTFESNSIDDEVLGTVRNKSQVLERLNQSFVIQLETGVSRSFSIGAMIPFVHKEERAFLASSGLRNSGIADVTLFFAHQDTIFNYWLVKSVLGLKIPIGTTQFESEGFSQPVSMQIGTGSWDQLILVSIGGRPFASSSFAINSTLSFRFNNIGLGLGAHDKFSFGDELQFTFGVGKQLLIGTQLFSPSIGLQLSWLSQNTIENLMDVNSGGTWMYSNAAITYDFSPSRSILMGVDIPVYEKLNGLQLATDLRWRLGLLFKIGNSSVFN